MTAAAAALPLLVLGAQAFDPRSFEQKEAQGLSDYGYACTGPKANERYKFCDTNVAMDERVEDLVRRINSGQAGSLLTARESTSWPEMNIPAYYWGTNAIHGLQNLDCLPDGQCPTSFPAPCGLGAAWNFSIVEDMARVIGRELRAYLNAGQHHSLDTWSPTINLNRDPRWGRNVESPSEDPMLNGLYAVAYTSALQNGDDPRYLQAAVTLKHFIAYSLESYGNETRHTFNAQVSEFDLADSYFPAWETAIKRGKAAGIMCSYNELNGVPTCGNPKLNETLRKDWGFDGYITSDTDACYDIFETHKYVANGTLAVAKCLAGGTDIDSGNTYQGYLDHAVTFGEAPMSDVRKALFNSFKIRFRLGLFDPKISSPLREISPEIVGTDKHQGLSLHAARQTMVLLKNEENTLPFAVGKNIAVIGASANSTKDLLGNYVGPICPNGKIDCFPTLYQGIQELNKGGKTSLHSDVKDINGAQKLAGDSDLVVLIASNANDGGSEGMDRVSIGLDSKQQSLCEAVLKTARNKQISVVLLLINGGAISIEDLIPMSPAILEAFSPGVHGARAVAETLFGVNNPGGKLPVTIFPKDYVDKIDFFNMSMTAGPGRTYRYYKGPVVYPFGFGLSYTTFSVKWKQTQHDTANLDASTLAKGQKVTYKVEVTNTGKVAGDEVVQLFTKSNQSQPLLKGAPVPIRTLAAFRRVHLSPGESIQITFEIGSRAFSLVDANGHRSIYPGSWKIEATRGHGEVLEQLVEVKGSLPVRVSEFKKWW